MSPTVAIPTFARGRAEVLLVTAGSAVAVITALSFGPAENVTQRAIVGAAGIALIGIAFALLRRLELALYAFVPLMTAVWIAPAPVDFLTVGLLGALVVRGEVRRLHPPRIVLVALGVLVMSYAAALALAPSDRSFSYAATTLLVIAIGCVTYALAARDPRVAERAFVLAGIVLAAEAILAISPVGTAMRNGLGVRGLFDDPNEFGAFAVPAVVLLCVRWPSLSRALRYTGLGILLFPIVASLSRGAALALGVALVVLAAVALYRHLRRVLGRSVGILALGAVALVAVLAFAGSALPERDASSLVQPYDAERFAGQLAGIQQVLTHPTALGIGPGNYEALLGHESRETYLRMLVETGPFSLIALLLLAWSVIRLIRLPDLETLAWVSAFAGLAACGLFIDTLHWRELWVVMAVALAVVAHRERAVAVLRPRAVQTSQAQP